MASTRPGDYEVGDGRWEWESSIRYSWDDIGTVGRVRTRGVVLWTSGP